MKVGIIAAGIGERMAKNGIGIPKPLIPLQGVPMIARLIRTAARLKAASVACIVNGVDLSVSSYLKSDSWPIPLELVVKTTPNSMESLLALEPLLREHPFLLLTVDAVFPFSALEQMVASAERRADSDGGILALTTSLDDEKPLWTKIDPCRRIVAIGNEAAGATPYATAGFYYFTPGVFSISGLARERKLKALREYLGLLLEEGYPLYGFPVSGTIDVDYPADIAKAESFLHEIGETI